MGRLMILQRKSFCFGRWIVKGALREKCPNVEFFLSPYFPVFGTDKKPYFDTFQVVKANYLHTWVKTCCYLYTSVETCWCRPCICLVIFLFYSLLCRFRIVKLLSSSWNFVDTDLGLLTKKFTPYFCCRE